MPFPRISRLAVFALLLILGRPEALAQELTGLAGAIRFDEPEAHSYTWMLCYSKDLNRNLAASFSWMNEGHAPSHHRDGLSGEPHRV